MNIVLFEPEIPPNTGNVMRTCAVTGSVLHLVEPLGFELESRHMRRAGLDYWPRVDIRRYPNMDALLDAISDAPFYLYTTRASRRYDRVRYQPGDFLIFGKETEGLPEDILDRFPERCLRVPMLPGNRCLNLSNTVAIVLYEALRQMDFPGLI